jgi:hypothetical protein
MPCQLGRSLLWQDWRWVRRIERLWECLPGRVGLREQPLRGFAPCVQGADVHDGQWRPLLRDYRQWLRGSAGMRRQLPGGMDLRGTRVQGQAARVHARILHDGQRRPLLWTHR